ncbi:protein AMN1 homolog isoform X2 [Acropora millepora]|uniref:protein AMN1 homolog isoform X2 n=1 Tax=Acropora millepora TaxID=45264 RepID=UPI001CF538CD|nr:protein AMN1 homolog isoform X2 [Acropora millepora]
MAVFCVVSSLQNHCLRAVACQLPNHETSLYALPVEIKAKLIHLLSKRGLLTDSNIEKVLHPSLRDLELCECRISDSGLASLCVCKNLRKLDLNATKNSRDDITSEGVIKVFTSCCQLQTVYLRRCINVSDTAIITLTENCRHLEHLNLCGCINITDTSLHVLAKNCKFLQSLNISKTKVTDNGIMQLTTGKCRQSIKGDDRSYMLGRGENFVNLYMLGTASQITRKQKKSPVANVISLELFNGIWKFRSHIVSI